MNLFTDEQISRARQRVTADDSARRQADSITRAAAPWLQRDDQVIRDLIPEASVPRALAVNYVSGCPVHGGGPKGHGGYAQGGWKYDAFVDRWHITCAVGGEIYPSNDFEAFYQTGMQDRSLLTGPYADDGWGWQASGSPHRHWFVGSCCQRLWQTILSGVTTLAQAYLVGGESAYAHKTLVLLDRIAELYPDMDYGTQAMYGREFSPGYTGKILDQISETVTARNLCFALDAVRDALPADPTFGPSAEATRAKLEKGIIGASLDGVYGGLIRGNYGGHQETLLIAALVSGDREEIAKAVDWAVDNTGEESPYKEMHTSFDDYIFRDKAAHAEGMNFALDNLIFREGIGWESSPSYNSGWVLHMANIAALVEPLGVRLWEHPKMKRMFRWATEMTCLDQFVPAIGDCGGPDGGHVQFSAGALRTAYRATQDPFIGELLRQHGSGFDSFESLFEDIPTPEADRDAAAWIRKLKDTSYLMGGYGLALLRTGRGVEQCAVSMYYGRAATEHGHFDRLCLELFAYGRKPIPEHGYGEHAAEGRPPAIWTKNTLPHATVVVDGRRQDTQLPGRLEVFSAAKGLSLAEVDAPDAYHSVSEYRRTLALIDVADDARYVLDLFRVAGGNQHDYSMHGFDSAFSTDGVALSPPQTQGSLAGEDVPPETIYDDDGLVDFERKGRSYYTYRGGGYSYLYDVQRAPAPARWKATWQGEDMGLRAHFLPSAEAIVAHGDPPNKPGNPKHFTYVLLRNEGDGIASQFAAVLEPYKGDPSVQSLEKLEQTATSIALRVKHRQGEDTVRHAVGPSGTCFSLVRRDLGGQVVRLDLMGVGSASGEGVGLTISQGLTGRVVSVAPQSSTVEIERDRDSQPFRKTGLIGSVARFGNGRRTSAYTITSVEGRGRRFRIGFGDETFRIGRLAVTGLNADGSGVSTKTCLYLASQGYYRGARLVDEAYQAWVPVEDVKLSPHRPGARRDGSVSLVDRTDLSDHFAVGKIAYLYDFGPGDTFSVGPQATATRRPDGTFRVQGNCRAELSV